MDITEYHPISHGYHPLSLEYHPISHGYHIDITEYHLISHGYQRISLKYQRISTTITEYHQISPNITRKLPNITWISQWYYRISPNINKYHSNITWISPNTTQYHMDITHYHSNITQYHMDITWISPNITKYHMDISEYHSNIKQYQPHDRRRIVNNMRWSPTSSATCGSQTCGCRGSGPTVRKGRVLHTSLSRVRHAHGGGFAGSEVWVTSQRLGGTRVAFLHVRTPTHSPPDVKTGRGTPRSLYTLLNSCMFLFCFEVASPSHARQE